MKILVIGKDGQLSNELEAFDFVETVGMDRADLTDPQGCADLIARGPCDAVINAAAYTAVDKAEEEEAIAAIINGDAPGAMAKACAEKGIPFVHVSTDYVFGGEGDMPFLPDDTVSPINAYGRTKRLGEDKVRAAGGVFAILRTSWVVSAHGHNFIKTMLRLAESRDALTIVSDQIGGPTSATPLAAACHTVALELIKAPEKSGTYHFSGSPDTSWADFARAIFKQSGKAVEVRDIATRDYPTPAKRPANSRLDCTSLFEQFGIARPDWREELTKILTALKSKG